MTVKAKRFRIGVEGATTDGREIQREWLEQMAASYNPAVYTALINLEHIKSYLPDSTFNRYGKVTALFTKKEQSDDARFSDVHKAVELVATEQQNLSARTEKSLSEQEERLSELETALQAQQTAFNELVNKLSHEDSRQDYRQRATGGNAPADTLTNC
ncbi:TPA: GPO family capsid scaffolding protein [Escherichia coli]